MVLSVFMFMREYFKNVSQGCECLIYVYCYTGSPSFSCASPTVKVDLVSFELNDWQVFILVYYKCTHKYKNYVVHYKLTLEMITCQSARFSIEFRLSPNQGLSQYFETGCPNRGFIDFCVSKVWYKVHTTDKINPIYLQILLF